MDTKEKWLEKSFEHFAEYGPRQLRIRNIASEIGVPRTTFYHHFADKEDLVSQLLERYLLQVETYTRIGKEYCKKLMPDLHEVIAMDILLLKFSRQLFLNRSDPYYNMVFINARDKTNKVIIPLFIDYYHFTIPYSLAEDLWNSLSESWYSRLDPDDLTAGSMQKLTEEIMETVLRFARSKLFVMMQEP